MLFPKNFDTICVLKPYRCLCRLIAPRIGPPDLLANMDPLSISVASGVGPPGSISASGFLTPSASLDPSTRPSENIKNNFPVAYVRVILKYLEVFKKN